jgi:hypothetical protein
MCFKITPALREYYRYRGISADFERRGFGSSKPRLAWMIGQKQHEPEKPVDDQNNSVNSSSPNTPDSNELSISTCTFQSPMQACLNACASRSR